jgi:hypothetical protein
MRVYIFSAFPEVPISAATLVFRLEEESKSIKSPSHSTSHCLFAGRTIGHNGSQRLHCPINIYSKSTSSQPPTRHATNNNRHYSSFLSLADVYAINLRLLMCQCTSSLDTGGPHHPPRAEVIITTLSRGRSELAQSSRPHHDEIT